MKKEQHPIVKIYSDIKGDNEKESMRRELELRKKYDVLKDEAAKRKEDENSSREEYLLNDIIRNQERHARFLLKEESNSGNNARLKYVKEKIRLDGTILYIGEENMDLRSHSECGNAKDRMVGNTNNENMPRFFLGIRLILILIKNYKLKTSSKEDDLINDGYRIVKFLNGKNPALLEKVTDVASMKKVANKILELCKTGLVIKKIKKEYQLKRIENV